MSQTAAHLVDHVIPPVPVRQWVISVPKRLRGMLADRPAAVNALTKIFLDEIERLLSAAAGVTEAATDMLTWENSGFSSDASVRITLFRLQLRVYCQPLEHLLRYCARPPFALERLSVSRGPVGRITRIRYVLPRHKAATWVGPGRQRKSTRPGASGIVELSPLAGRPPTGASSSRPGQPRETGATRSRAAHPSGNAGESAIGRAILTLLKGLGINVVPHDMSHYQPGERMDASQKRDATQSELLAAVKESDGTSLLDNTTLVYGSNIRSIHYLDNCPTLVAGGGSGIRLGEHVVVPDKTPLADLWLTLLKGAGVKAESHGDSTGVVKELFV